jgi:hypothetical protein
MYLNNYYLPSGSSLWALKDLETNDPRRAGFLSYYILWGNSTNIQTNIRDFKSRFNV